jgi:thiol-disulfide isomerase/thioredoxin
VKFTNLKTILVVSIVLTGFLIYYFLYRTPFSEKKPAVNDVAPEISLADLSGKMVRLSDYSGKVVLINFWASWCPICKDEMPGFQKIYEEYGDKGFVVIGIALDDVTPSLIMDMRILYPILKTNRRVTKNYGNIKSVPVSFLIGKDGRVIKKLNNYYPENSLRDDVEKALGSKG